MRFVHINRPVQGDRAVKDLRTGRTVVGGLSRDAAIAYAVALNASVTDARREAKRSRAR